MKVTLSDGITEWTIFIRALLNFYCAINLSNEDWLKIGFAPSFSI